MSKKFKQFLAVFVIRSLIIGLVYTVNPGASFAESGQLQDQGYLMTNINMNRSLSLPVDSSQPS